LSVSFPYELALNTVDKEFQGKINLDWEIDSIATCSATLKEAEELAAFVEIDIERDDVIVFNGRIEKPSIHFSRKGRPMPITGFDWTAILRDYPTTSQSIVDSTTAAALTAILSEITDITLTEVTEGTFEYITALQDWDTSHEFLLTITDYTNCSIEYAFTAIELQNEFADARTIADFGRGSNGTNNCFFYDGATERFYIFTREGNDIIYYHSINGTAWTRVDTAVNSTTHSWSVAWHDSKVYFFIWDGAATDFYRGTIADATGTITFVLINNNAFAEEVRFGPVWDDLGRMHVVTDTATGTIRGSNTDGVNFTFSIVGAVNHNIWGLQAIGGSGDLATFVVDIPNDDLEEWVWDQGLSTHTYVAKIATTANDIDGLDAASNDNYAVWIVWNDGNNRDVGYRVASGNWTTTGIDASGSPGGLTIACDGGHCAYIFNNAISGFHAYKFRDGVEEVDFTDASVPWNTSGLMVGGTRCWDQDGNIAIFGCGTDGDADGWFYIFDPTGIRLNRGDTTGNFLTDAITASGGMVSWGILTAEGIGISNGVDVLWDIEDNASVVLADDQTAPFDLDVAGVDPSETTIKIHCYLDDNGPDPYVYEFDITEKTDAVSLDTDYEDAYTGVRKLADLAGAEFYVTKDNGTYTITFTTRRGSDKTASVILKAATTSDEPGTTPNIKVLNKTFDWSDYANVVQVIGGEDADGNRVSGVVRDNEEITAKGKEYWFTLRDADIVTNGMARQRAYVELTKRNSATLRIGGEFLDHYNTSQIEIGDSVILIAEWEDMSLKISGSHRIVKLNRVGGVGGEKVTADFTTKLKQAQFWNYLRLTDDQSRWITT